MSAPTEILNLVDLFHSNREEYRAQQYNEAQVRFQFLDPFFYALGWDVHNQQGHAEAYKDVIHEDAIKVGGAQMAECRWPPAGMVTGYPTPKASQQLARHRAAHAGSKHAFSNIPKGLQRHQKLAAAKTPHQKTALERQIKSTDRQIDQLVYELYGLTDAEIAIVEGAAPKSRCTPP